MSKISEYNSEYITKVNTSVSFEEKRKRYIVSNSQGRNIYKIQVDGGLINKGVRCDGALFFENEKEYLVLVELKGSDVPKAYEQLYETYNWFKRKNLLNGSVIYLRIVCSKVPKNYDNKYFLNKFKKQIVNFNGILVREDIIEEDIENLLS